jgi:nucleoside-diphosphate-sugar epimerase
VPHLIIFGPGYTASRIEHRLEGEGWQVTRIGRALFDDERAARPALASASHILSSVPPEGESDPVLLRHGAALRSSGARWIGYLSSTGVYGNTRGAWVDESAPIGQGRRSARSKADLGWQALHPETRVFRLPGIYGPGRSPLDRVREGRAHRIDLPEQLFSRVHVDDIVAGVIASMVAGPAGVYNLADDLPASQNAVIEAACVLLGLPAPPLLALEQAGLSPAARAFYSENRRVANGKAKRLLGWRPRYPSYRDGLRALLAAERSA